MKPQLLSALLDLSDPGVITCSILTALGRGMEGQCFVLGRPTLFGCCLKTHATKSVPLAGNLYDSCEIIMPVTHTDPQALPCEAQVAPKYLAVSSHLPIPQREPVALVLTDTMEHLIASKYPF